MQGRCVKDCCSHGSLGGLTAPYTCQNFHNSWQVTEFFCQPLFVVAVVVVSSVKSRSTEGLTAQNTCQLSVIARYGWDL